jgi:hypothetical protein
MVTQWKSVININNKDNDPGFLSQPWQKWCHDTQHNDNQHNDTQHNNK